MKPLTHPEIHHLWELMRPLRPEVSLSDFEVVALNGKVGPTYRIDLVNNTRVEVTMPDAVVSMERF